MTETPLHRVRNHLARVWRAQRAALLRAMTASPECLRAPHWIIRIRIFTYLLARYGDQPDVHYVAPRRMLRAIRDPAPPRTYGAPPRNREQIRQTLDTIVETNLIAREQYDDALHPTCRTMFSVQPRECQN